MGWFYLSISALFIKCASDNNRKKIYSLIFICLYRKFLGSFLSFAATFSASFDDRPYSSFKIYNISSSFISLKSVFFFEIINMISPLGSLFKKWLINIAGVPLIISSNFFVSSRAIAISLLLSICSRSWSVDNILLGDSKQTFTPL